MCVCVCVCVYVCVCVCVYVCVAQVVGGMQDAMLKPDWMFRWTRASVLKVIGFWTRHGNNFPISVKSYTILNWNNFPDLSNGSRTFDVQSKFPNSNSTNAQSPQLLTSWSSSDPGLWWKKSLACDFNPLISLDLFSTLARGQRCWSA